MSRLNRNLNVTKQVKGKKNTQSERLDRIFIFLKANIGVLHLLGLGSRYLFCHRLDIPFNSFKPGVPFMGHRQT